MRMETWTRWLAGLSLGGLVLTGCDRDPIDDHEGFGETEGMGDTEGAPPPADDDAEETEGADDPPPPPPDVPPMPEEPEACGQYGLSRTCTTDAGQSGTQYCDSIYQPGGSEQLWGPCLSDVECEPGDQDSCGWGGTGGEDFMMSCRLDDGVPSWDEEDCNTPLVLSFDGGPVRMDAAGTATFDLDVAGGCITTDWPAAATPWLALDRDRNGTIDSGRELFGSGTRLSSGQRARNGFAALAELDTDGDGRITMADARFDELVLWSDHDGDRSSTFAETRPLSSYRVLSVELGYHIDRQCDDRGNCGVERASFTFVDAQGAVREGEVVDVHLACQ